MLVSEALQPERREYVRKVTQATVYDSCSSCQMWVPGDLPDFRNIYLQSTVTHCTTGHANHQSSNINSSVTFSVSEFCRLIDNLVESGIHVVGEL